MKIVVALVCVVLLAIGMYLLVHFARDETGTVSDENSTLLQNSVAGPFTSIQPAAEDMAMELSATTSSDIVESECEDLAPDLPVDEDDALAELAKVSRELAEVDDSEALLAAALLDFRGEKKESSSFSSVRTVPMRRIR